MHAVVDLDVDLDGGRRPAPRDLPPDRRSDLLFIAREALSNVARHAGASRAIARARADGDDLVLAIEDNGRGFDPDALDGPDGFGHHQGLVNMRDRAVAMGGRLPSQRPADGRRAYHRPRARRSRPRTASGAPPAPATENPPMTDRPSRPLRLLVVDDHEVVRQGLVALLDRREGSRSSPRPAPSAEAIEQARRFQPDIVVMDVRLPDGSGIEAIREIRAELPGDPRGDAHLVSRRGGRPVAPSSPALGLPPEADPRPRPRGGARDRRPRRIAAGPRGHREGPRARPADRHRRATPTRWRRSPPRSRRSSLLVAEGKTNKEIAAEVFLSDKTVKNYVSLDPVEAQPGAAGPGGGVRREAPVRPRRRLDAVRWDRHGGRPRRLGPRVADRDDRAPDRSCSAGAAAVAGWIQAVGVAAAVAATSPRGGAVPDRATTTAPRGDSGGRRGHVRTESIGATPRPSGPTGWTPPASGTGPPPA